MSDRPDDLVLLLLRGIRDDISQIKGDMAEVKERLGLLEAGYASVSRRMDRLGGDVERIKVRLELVEAPAGV
jgi:predicted nuclease with TOPRIM domain